MHSWASNALPGRRRVSGDRLTGARWRPVSNVLQRTPANQQSVLENVPVTVVIASAAPARSRPIPRPRQTEQTEQTEQTDETEKPMTPETIERADTGSTGGSSQNVAVSVSVVVGQGAGESTYPMFEVRDLSPDGAFFASWLFLELHEEITVEIAMGDETVRLRAQVEALHKGDTPGMAVAFLDLNDEQRALLAHCDGREAPAPS